MIVQVYNTMRWKNQVAPAKRGITMMQKTDVLNAPQETIAQSAAKNQPPVPPANTTIKRVKAHANYALPAHTVTKAQPHVPPVPPVNTTIKRVKAHANYALRAHTVTKVPHHAKHALRAITVLVDKTNNHAQADQKPPM